MTTSDEDLAVIKSVPTQMEAQLVVNLLRENGVEARSVGGFTSQYKTGAPGEVQVVVRQVDLVQAQEVMARIERENEQAKLAEQDLAEE